MRLRPLARARAAAAAAVVVNAIEADSGLRCALVAVGGVTVDSIRLDESHARVGARVAKGARFARGARLNAARSGAKKG